MYLLVALASSALVAGNQDFDAAACDIAGDISVYPLHEAPKLRSAKLAHPAAFHADRVVMVFHRRQAVLGSAIQ